MVKPRLLLLAAALVQAGCAATPERVDVVRTGIAMQGARCNPATPRVEVLARIDNGSRQAVRFHLDGSAGPPFDLWWVGYRVHSRAPEETDFKLVHNSGHDSVWTSTMELAPGEAADFRVPIWGLRPSDYRRYFLIELRDASGRSYWTPIFGLCSSFDLG